MSSAGEKEKLLVFTAVPYSHSQQHQHQQSPGIFFHFPKKETMQRRKGITTTHIIKVYYLSVARNSFVCLQRMYSGGSGASSKSKSFSLLLYFISPLKMQNTLYPYNRYILIYIHTQPCELHFPLSFFI